MELVWSILPGLGSNELFGKLVNRFKFLVVRVCEDVELRFLNFPSTSENSGRQ